MERPTFISLLTSLATVDSNSQQREGNPRNCSPIELHDTGTGLHEVRFLYPIQIDCDGGDTTPCRFR